MPGIHNGKPNTRVYIYIYVSIQYVGSISVAIKTGQQSCNKPNVSKKMGHVQVHYCGWTTSIPHTIKHYKTMVETIRSVGISREIIIPWFLRWCRFSSIRQRERERESVP